MEAQNAPVAAEVLADGTLDIKAACAFTALSRAELYSAMARGELRWLSYGKRRLIARRDLISWLQLRLVPHGQT